MKVDVSRTFSEVLQMQKVRQHEVSGAVPCVSGIVQKYEGKDKKLLGPNEVYLLSVLGEMEFKVEMLLEEITVLKRCVKGKGVRDMGQASGSNVMGQESSHVMQAGLEKGHGPGQAVGPKKAWRAMYWMPADISAQEL